MNVNFNCWEIFKVHLTSITGGNISTKTFHGLLDKIESVENIPAPIERALRKKAEKHADLDTPLSTAYKKRDDKINTAEIAKQQEILQEILNDSKIFRNIYINKGHCISQEVVDASDLDFKFVVADDLKIHNMNHRSMNETLKKSKNTDYKVKEQEESFNKLKAKIQEETRSFTPEEENKRTGYIHNHHGDALEEHSHAIEKYKKEAEAINSELLLQREIYNQIVINQAKKNPKFINDTMKPHLTDLKNVMKRHKKLLDIQMCAQRKINELTNQIEENKANDIEIMKAKDQVIKHPDAPTHKTKSTLTDKKKNTSAAG